MRDSHGVGDVQFWGMNKQFEFCFSRVLYRNKYKPRDKQMMTYSNCQHNTRILQYLSFWCGKYTRGLSVIMTLIYTPSSNRSCHFLSPSRVVPILLPLVLLLSLSSSASLIPPPPSHLIFHLHIYFTRIIFYISLLPNLHVLNLTTISHIQQPQTQDQVVLFFYSYHSPRSLTFLSLSLAPPSNHDADPSSFEQITLITSQPFWKRG